jgi:hypothetical protein
LCVWVGLGAPFLADRAPRHPAHSIRYLRLLFRAMARVPGTEHLFFKFQSMVSRQMDIVVEAFPDTPWLFFYRNAVEVCVLPACARVVLRAVPLCCVACASTINCKRVCVRWGCLPWACPSLLDVRG